MIYNFQSGKSTNLVLSFKFWAITLILVLFYSAILFAQNTVYVDPENEGDPAEDGTIDHPFNSWSDVSFASDRTYLQKRGTTAQGNIVIHTRNNVKISAYGDGDDPIITGIPGSETKILVFNGCTNSTVENIKFLGHHPMAPTAGVFLNGYSAQSHNITVRNCDISFCYNGVRVMQSNYGNDGLTLDGVTIHHINEDGIFIDNLSNFTCRNSHVYKVNQDWHYDCHDFVCASGDGIQLTGNCDNFLLENTIVDRRDTGLKFCFIHNATDNNYQNDGIIRDCTFYSPKDTIGAPSAGGAIFLFDGDSVLIERTKFIGSERIFSNDIGIGGQLSFDHIIMNYVLFDSVINLGVTYRVDDFVANNITWTANKPGTSALQLGAGTSIINNSAFAGSTGTTMITGGYSGDSTKVYVGPTSNWDSEFGWVDWEHGDYHLTSSSPILNKGKDVALYYDIDSIPVPQGPCQDIGAYERTDGSSTNNYPVIQNQSFNVDENVASGQSVGIIIASDPDAGQSLTYAITGGNTNNAFSINPGNGNLSVNNASALNFEVNPSFNLTIKITDNGTPPLSVYGTVTVNINDINEVPEVNNQVFSVNENSANGTNVGVVVASDPDNGQFLTYAISSGNSGNTFSLNSSTGQLSVSNNTLLDYESITQFSLVVTVTDNGIGNLSSQASITININDLNEVPEITAQSFNVDENSLIGTIVGTVLATDPDNGQSLTFGISAGNAGNTFQINTASGQLTISNPVALNFETNPVFTLTITVTDNGTGNLTNQAIMTINVNDVNEVPEIYNQFFVVDESIGNGETVGVVIATDPDQGQSLTFSIIGGNEDGAFAIDPNSGELAVADNSVLNFNANPTYFLDVEVQDNGVGQLSDQAVISVTADNVNLAPVIENQEFALAENSPSGQSVGIVVATDPNPDQTLTFSILSGNTNNAFQINATTGSLTVNNGAALNYELIQSFNLVVKVQDDGNGNLTDQAVITVNLTDVNEVPEIAAQSFNLDENSPLSTIVGTIAASDPDNGQSLIFALTGGNLGNTFSIGLTNGQLTVVNPNTLNFEENPVFTLTVSVTDNGAGNLSAQATVTINLNDLNEVPEINNQVFTIEENSNSNMLVGTIIASDPDNGQTLNYTILNGNINSAFTINSTNGEIIVNNSGALNFENISMFNLTVAVTDNGVGTLSSQAVVTINLIDVNEAPIVQNQVFSIDENSGSGIEIGTVVAADPDLGQSLFYSIVSGNIDLAFSIDNMSGMISINNVSAIDFELNPSFNLVVQVNDNGTPVLSSQSDITVYLNDINEVPEVDDQSFSIDENSVVGSVVGIVLASDPDAGQSLTYSIVSGNLGNTFGLNTSTGMITVNDAEMLDFESFPVFSLIIKAEDNGVGNLYDMATVTIALQNVNEAPVILSEAFSVTIDAALLVPDINGNIVPVGTIQAFDPDAGQTLSYEITFGNHLGIWELSGNAGELDVVNPYAFSPLEVNVYSLQIEVSDNAAQPLTTTSDVIIYVNIVNLDEFIEDIPMTTFAQKEEMDFDVSVYPNPAKDYIKIETEEEIEDDLYIRFYSLQGEIILAKEISPGFSKISSRLDVSQLSNGIYVVNIIHGKVSKNVRLIKQ